MAQLVEPGPQMSERRIDLHGREEFHFAAMLQFVHQVGYRPFPQGPQRLFVAGREARA